MKVIKHIENATDTQFSYEIIPPLRGKGIQIIIDMIEDLKKSFSFVRGVKLRRNYGKSAALQAGFDIVKGDFICTKYRTGNTMEIR